MHDVVIIGAGLAGLCCARELSRRGQTCLLLEASDRVGGRVRTEMVEGFRIDRGFQVLLTSYPEARAILDFDALQLHEFLPGALVRYGGKFHELTDPWRRPFAALLSLASPIGTFTDKLRVADYRGKVLRGPLVEGFEVPETTALEDLREAGFTPAMIERFFRPFLGGIFLDPQLVTSNRMLRFVFRMFSLGPATLPAEGMQAIPRQLAAGLPEGTIRLNAPVASIRPDGVTLGNGMEVPARAVVVATEGPAADRLLQTLPTAGPGVGRFSEAVATTGQGVTCLSFAAARAPVQQPILVLNGDGTGPINNLCVPTAVAPSYGPPDRSLVSVTVLGVGHDPAALERDVREQLVAWYGPAPRDWHLLRVDTIPYALPRQAPPALAVPERSVRWRAGVYVCGDHRDNASIQGAMVSGRRAAEALLEDLS
jgi:phytoene dehydrogenase-like protein